MLFGVGVSRYRMRATQLGRTIRVRPLLRIRRLRQDKLQVQACLAYRVNLGLVWLTFNKTCLKLKK